MTYIFGMGLPNVFACDIMSSVSCDVDLWFCRVYIWAKYLFKYNNKYERIHEYCNVSY